MLPALGAALLPKLFCPACWPAYAGLLSSVGIGFFNYTPWIMPLTLFFVLIALTALFWRAKNRRGYGPFLLGLVASSILVVGKFIYESDVAMYIGLAMLVSASLWNTWPIARKTETPHCAACTSSVNHGQEV
ncbi:MAG: MerC domain-containing protein [Proteobacteria bacterium]|nr:MerC domain-containing protein [Pseudomonadota bacterium]